MRPIVLLTHAIHANAMELLAAHAEVRVLAEGSQAELERQIGQADALLVRMPASPASIRAGQRLRVVARHGVGLDYIPVDLCSELGIQVTFTPDANTESVAEHVIGAMIALAHGFGPADREVRRHNWKWRDGFIGRDLFGRTLGIIGVGRIGGRVAQIANGAFSMDVLGYDPFLDADTIATRSATAAPLDELLSRSEFITLHLPLTAATHHVLDADRIGKIRRGAYLINAARGGLVDTAALAKALASGSLAGAALDVLEEEPPNSSNPLLGLENVLFTPHSAALTEEAMLRMGMTAAEDIVRVLQGDAPKYPANRI